MRRYVLVQLLETPAHPEFAASAWPLHLTLMPNFALSLDGTAMHRSLSDALADRPRVTTTAGAEARFGPDGTVRVTLLDPVPALRSLHRLLHGLLVDAGAVFENPAYVLDGYRPHITVQRHRRLDAGDEVVIDAIALVDLAPDDDSARRRILDTVGLSRS